LCRDVNAMFSGTTHIVNFNTRQLIEGNRFIFSVNEFIFVEKCCLTAHTVHNLGRFSARFLLFNISMDEINDVELEKLVFSYLPGAGVEPGLLAWQTITLDKH